MNGGTYKFRDALFKRYGDVSFLLRSMRFNDLIPFIQNMYAEIFEEKLWNIYLSNPFREGSFSEFKEKVAGDGRTKEQIENEAKEAADRALLMLESYGGGFDGV